SWVDEGGFFRADSESTKDEGRRLGAYELMRELGRGGMGAVWLARRADQQFEKLVAIKLLKRGTDTEEILRRFQAERQILARLDHPNIARLLDAGTSEDGLPYFVMEYVDGQRLTDYARAKSLSLGERLRLFQHICGAVQFAHQNLVIHRDLKPGNILINAAGEPTLLDFGVAKLLAPDDESWQQTIAGQERFTPGYASPEQVRGEPITTVSDVYSLGALLYELLTDTPTHPFSTKTPTATQITQVVCEQEPARPSNAAPDPEMRRRLRGDLDTILLRALAKSPQRRYRSPGDLADDLQRYRDDRPVRARPDTLLYRTNKFLRRNRMATAAAALIVLSLIGGVIATARQAQFANRERARAERRFLEVRKLANSLMVEFHDAIADLPGALAARQLVTRRAVDYLDRLAQETGDDLALQSELALAYEKIGNLTFDAHQATTAHEKAVALNEAVLRAAPGHPAYRLQLSDSYDQLGDVFKITGHSRAAIASARKALATAQPIAAAYPANLAALYLGLATALQDAGDYPAALENAEAAFQIRQRLAAQKPARAETRRELEIASSLLADTSAVLGDFPRALEEDKRAQAIAEELFATDPASSRYRRDMWSTQFRFGRHLAATGDRAHALHHLQRARNFLEALATADPNDTGHQRWLALTWARVGSTQAALGQGDAARALLEKALALSEKLARDDPERVEVRSDLCEIERALGAFWLGAGDRSRAAHFFQRAAATGRELLAKDPDNARVRQALAQAEADEKAVAQLPAN
ncbi:MAG: protein kinase, partial [Verrucomicrobiota bacterium]|nr:protein kinase [Verrucomicrobiota bacterium]